MLGRPCMYLASPCTWVSPCRRLRHGHTASVTFGIPGPDKASYSHGDTLGRKRQWFLWVMLPFRWISKLGSWMIWTRFVNLAKHMFASPSLIFPDVVPRSYEIPLPTNDRGKKRLLKESKRDGYRMSHQYILA